MPRLYEYLGMLILFYSNEHEPIHVHGKYQGAENKAEILFIEGKFIEVRIVKIKGKKELPKKQKAQLKTLVEAYRDDIVNKWISFFVYNKTFEAEVINKLKK